MTNNDVLLLSIHLIASFLSSEIIFVNFAVLSLTSCYGFTHLLSLTIISLLYLNHTKLIKKRLLALKKYGTMSGN